MQQKKKARPLFAALLAAVLMLALLPLPAYAAPNYTFENGVLTIHNDTGMTEWVTHAAGGLDSNKVVTLVVEAGVTKIANNAFNTCVNLKSVTLPGGLEEIGVYAFARCTSLTSVTLPDSLVKIGVDAFARCTSLTSVTLPDSLTEIGAGAFRDCTVLTTLTFQGQAAPSLGADVFNGLTQNITINVPYGATGYDKGTWLTNIGSVKLKIEYAAPPAPTPAEPESAAPAPEAEGVPHVCYFGDWQYSNEHHWKRCSCMALSDYAPHVFNSARVCTVCGYGAKAKKVNPQTSVYDSGLPQSFSKPLLFHFAPLIGA